MFMNCDRILAAEVKLLDFSTHFLNAPRIYRGNYDKH